MRQTLTTGFGFAAILLALVGAIWVALAYSHHPNASADAIPLLVLECVLSLGAKCTLFLTGAMLLRRSRLVWLALVATLSRPDLLSVPATNPPRIRPA